MKNIVITTYIVTALCSPFSLHAMGYVYAQAIDKHVQSVVRLMNEEASRDSDKIVIVPKAFRQDYVQDAVDAGRLFVALRDTHVIGYKKLFGITDPQERDEGLVREVCCVTAPTACYAPGIYAASVCI